MTGVQTCALPICETDPTPEELAAIEAEELAQEAAEDAAPENDTEE